MRILNLTPGARMISLRTQDIILKPFSLSVEFLPTERLIQDIIMTVDYQNKYRIVMDASEKSQYSNHPMIPGVIVSAEDAEIIEKNLASKIYPPKLDIFGKEVKSEKVDDPNPQPDAAKVEDPKSKDANPENPNPEEPKSEEPAPDEVKVNSEVPTQDEKKIPELKWDSDRKTVEFGKIRIDTKYRELINPENLQVAYTSTNTDVATIDENGIIDVKQKGETNILATSVETEEFASTQASYKLIVK